MNLAERLNQCNLYLYDRMDAFEANYPASVDYPHDRSYDHFEKCKLIQYANMMRIILFLVNKVEGHRDHAIELAVRLTEGKKLHYNIDGAKNKVACSSLRRKYIYWHEGGQIGDFMQGPMD